VIQRDNGFDPFLQERINELTVPFQPFMIDRVIPSPEWDDSAPTNGEPIRFRAIRFEELNILLIEIVRVCRNVASYLVLGPPRFLGESIPDRGSSAVSSS
jgi:hypothetical protein